MASDLKPVNPFKPYLVPAIIAVSIAIGLYSSAEGIRSNMGFFLLPYIPFLLAALALYVGIKLKLKGDSVLSYGSVLAVGGFLIMGIIAFIIWPPN